jgi:hypothetical protein
MLINDGDGEDLDGGFSAVVTDLSGESPDDDSFDLGDMSAGTDDAVDTEAPAATPSATPATQPVTKAGTQQPAPQAPAPQATGPQPQQPSQAQPAVDFETYVQQNAEAIITQYAQNTFALSKDEAEAFGDVAPMVPRLLARAHLISQTQTLRALQATLPTMVGRLVQLSRQGADTEQRLFNDYPQLKSVDRAALASLVTTLRQHNPTTSVDDFLPLLARTASAYFGVTIPPVRATGVRRQPHVPAGANGGGAPRTRVVSGGQQQTNPLFAINEALRSGQE